MGSGHILVYAFDVFMQLYEAEGESSRRAAELILQNNLYGLDIDKRAFQLAYFALMMKGRQYSRRILNRGIQPNVYDIPDNFGITEDDLVLFPHDFENLEKGTEDLKKLIRNFKDGNDLGSLIQFEDIDFENLESEYQTNSEEQLTFDGYAIHDMIQVAKLLQQSFEVVVTNPPYMGSGGFNPTLSSFAKKTYPNSKSDLFAMFIERWNKSTASFGYNSMVTMQSWMFLSSYEKMRKQIVDQLTISNLMHMENMVMGIAFGTAVTVLWNTKNPAFRGTYHQIKTADASKGAPEEVPVPGNRFNQISQNDFTKIPGMPISYWVSENLIHDFETGTRMDEVVSPKVGLQTGKNNEFLRLWWEVAMENIKFDATSIDNSVASGKKWFPYNKGGSFRRWYGNYDYVVNWENDGEEIRNFVDKEGKLRSRPQNTDFYFREAITWPLITSGGLSARYREPGSIHDVSGMSAFSDSLDDIYYILGLVNTPIGNAILKILNPTINSQVGDFQNIPVLMNNDKKQDIIINVKNAVDIAKSDWNLLETSWGFEKHAYLSFETKNTSLKSVQEEFDSVISDQIETLKNLEFHINKSFIKIYNLDEFNPEVDKSKITLTKINHSQDIKQFISYAVGCMFGRYSLDVNGLAYARDEWNDSNYESFQPDKDNILLVSDDKHFEESSIDIVNRFVEFIRVALGKENLEGNLQFIADILGGKGTSREVIRGYFVKDFYKDHLQTYKKRPIYWQFESGKNDGFKALIYLHRYSPETLGTMRVDYLHELQKAYENTIEQLQHQTLQSLSSVDKNVYTKRLQKIRKQYEETTDYDAKLGHLANLQISLDLDDGVIVNYDKLQTDENGKNLKVLSKRT